MIKKLQNALQAISGFDGALILSPENRYYLTGFHSSNGFLLVSKDRAVFITDGRYIEAAQAKLHGCEVVLQTTDAGQLKALFEEMGVQNVAVENSRMTIADFSKYAQSLAPVQIVPDSTLDNILCALRAVKTEDEIEKMVRAQRIAEAALEHVLGVIRPGKTEKEIQLELDFYMLSHGAEGLSFETIAVSGQKSSMPHGVPDDKVIEDGDFLTMDFGAIYEGYHSDMTRTVAVGHVTEEQRWVYATVLAAQTAGLEALHAGLACKAADRAARQVIEDAGYGAYYNHSTGHGVGIEIHEHPFDSPRSESVLSVGNVVTVEPGIYIPGQFGVRIEDMAVVTKDGHKNLTKAPKELIIL